MSDHSAVTLTVVGSADAFNAAGRGHSCTLLEGAGVGPLMIDFGATALAGLHRIGRSAADLAAVAFTHLHGDHTGGLPFLLIDGRFHHQRSAPLELVGPPATAEHIDALCRACYGELLAEPLPFEVRHHVLDVGGEVAVAGVRLRAFAADHQDPPAVALCLRVILPGGQVIAFSGDTAPCEGLREAAAGASLLVAECSAMAPPCGRHLTWQSWGQLLGQIGAEQVLLVHLGEQVRARAASLLAELPAGVSLSFAEDGMRLLIAPR